MLFWLWDMYLFYTVVRDGWIFFIVDSIVTIDPVQHNQYAQAAEMLSLSQSKCQHGGDSIAPA